jgi:hypothetical protein
MISAATVIVGSEVIRPARYQGRRPAGIESITSVAIVDSADPIRSAASLPARAWAMTAAQAAANGSSPRASSAATTPERTSPAGGGQAMGRDLIGVDLEQAAELSCVRSEDRRRVAGRNPVEQPGERIEAVGVEDQRRLDRADHLSRQFDRGRVAPQPGPEDAGSGPLEGAQHRLRRGRREESVATGTAG